MPELRARYTEGYATRLPFAFIHNFWLYLEIDFRRGIFHGEWNYTIFPRQQNTLASIIS